ncbi:MAG: hypothetical protein JWN30_888 [Bacilli bacterium]|nr:hypothetical protein [Bacilli bacterium]
MSLNPPASNIILVKLNQSVYTNASPIMPMGDLYYSFDRGGRVRQFSRNLMYTCTALATVLFAGVGVTLGSYKTVKLNVDGQIREVHTLRHATVADLLRWQGVAVSEHDQVEPVLTSQLRPTETIWVDHAREVSIKDGDNPPQVVYTHTHTISTLLQQLDVSIGNSDAINVRLDSPPMDNQTVTITRRSQDVSVTQETIPFQTERQPDSSMYKGDEKVLSPGVEGLAKVTTTVKYENGKATQTNTDRVVVQDAQNKVVTYGTADRPVIVASRSSVDYSSSGAMTMVATAYSAPGGRTASGLPAQHGVVAVDPSVIPLGTRLYIDGYGYAVAGDTGSAIIGNKIDLCFDTLNECLQFGRQNVSVHIVN